MSRIFSAEVRLTLCTPRGEYDVAGLLGSTAWLRNGETVGPCEAVLIIWIDGEPDVKRVRVDKEYEGVVAYDPLESRIG